MKKLIALVVFCILAAAGVLGYQGYEKSLQDDLYAEAYIFYEEGDYKKAIQYLEKAEEKNNLFSGALKEEILYYKADSHLKLTEYAQAVAIYDTLIEKEPEEVMNYLLKGFCQSSSGMKKEAAATYESGYEKTGSPKILVRLCNLHLSMNDYDAAEEVLTRAETLEKEEAKELAFLKIIICEKQLDYEKAYEAAVRYCEDYPDDERGLKEKTFLESRK